MLQETVIKIENLCKSFGDNQVLKNVNIELKKGEQLALLGRSGTGKSVLIKNIMGILKPDSGSIFINNIDVTKLTQNEMLKANFNMGMLFQASALFDSLTVKENIIFYKSVHQKISKQEAKDLAVYNLELVGLSASILNKLPSELSGGMQKRVALARLLVQKPQIVFFDEPTTGLDPITSEVINELIIKTTKYLGATSLMITHDINSAMKIADKAVILHYGENIWQGAVGEMHNCNNEIVKNFVNGIIT